MEIVRVAVEGCCHGELDTIYKAIQNKRNQGQRVDLLLICGDFQCIRHNADFESVAVPPKYRKLNNFSDYVTGKKVAPVMTIFVGGNHEASNILQSLYYGGFVAPNIYFLGFAGVVRYGGLRIAGLSGIFNEAHYKLGRYESPPYLRNALKSIYHVREVEVYRMAHLQCSSQSSPLDAFLSHDWPAGITKYGNEKKLLQIKPYFREDINKNELGSPPLMHLLHMIKPQYWFAAHLHCRFDAIVRHPPSTTLTATSSNDSDNINGTSEDITNDLKSTQSESSILNPTPSMTISPQIERSTKFLALDKVLPRREFIDFLDIKPSSSSSSHHPPAGNPHDFQLEYDIEWLAILKRTHTLTQVTHNYVTVPTWVNPITPEEMKEVETLIRKNNNNSLIIRNIPPTTILPPVNTLSQQNRSSSSYSNTYTGHPSQPPPPPMPPHPISTTTAMMSSLSSSSSSSHPPPPSHPPSTTNLNHNTNTTTKRLKLQSINNTLCEPVRMGNQQTDWLLETLNLPHICTVPYSIISTSSDGLQSGKNINVSNSYNTTTTAAATATAIAIVTNSHDENEIELPDDDDNNNNSSNNNNNNNNMNDTNITYDSNEIQLPDDIDDQYIQNINNKSHSDVSNMYHDSNKSTLFKDDITKDDPNEIELDD